MTICIFADKVPDGSGDIVQAIKIADYVKKQIDSDVLIIVLGPEPKRIVVSV